MGFAGLQFGAPSSGLDLTTLSTSGRREFLHILSAQDMKMVGFSAAVGDKGLGPAADIDRELDRLDHLMESAAAMGAPLLCLDAGPLPEPPAAARPRPAISPDLAGAILLPSMN
ncbi:MAG TPA: hypothetical protein VGD75_12130, partial [Bradyrhizobium sp.]